MQTKEGGATMINKNTRKLFYIGDDFYWSSSTNMSCIYEINTGKRYDWGFVQSDLRDGETVNIRPANKEELAWAENMEKKIRESRDQNVITTTDSSTNNGGISNRTKR